MANALFKSTNARDFVNDKSSAVVVDKTKKLGSILRNSHKSDEEDLLSGKDTTDSKLSKENLSKHVRIFAVDNNDLSNDSSTDLGRRESFGSMHSYNAHRKMSIDSLDCRRSSGGSRRASIASGDDEVFIVGIFCIDDNLLSENNF